MRGYLLDTNHLSAAIRTVSPVRERLLRTRAQGYRLITCWPVLCELKEGMIFLADQARYAQNLEILVREMRIWPMDWKAVDQYAMCAKMVRQRGRQLAIVDLILAAFAIKENVVLLTSDRDFEALPEIKTENWI